MQAREFPMHFINIPFRFYVEVICLSFQSICLSASDMALSASLCINIHIYVWAHSLRIDHIFNESNYRKIQIMPMFQICISGSI